MNVTGKRMCPKIRRTHLYPTNFQKMNVPLAVQVCFIKNYFAFPCHLIILSSVPIPSLPESPHFGSGNSGKIPKFRSDRKSIKII
jgi:hypothetical protein